MRPPIVAVDGVILSQLMPPEVKAVVLLMGLGVSSLLVFLVLTVVSLSVSKRHDPQPDKNLKANVTAADH